jgi:hypothetical protein
VSVRVAADVGAGVPGSLVRSLAEMALTVVYAAIAGTYWVAAAHAQGGDWPAHPKWEPTWDMGRSTVMMPWCVQSLPDQPGKGAPAA